jgi:hypothetical protein
VDLALDDLVRDLVDEREPGAEALVASPDLGHRPVERGDVQRSVELEAEGDVVRALARQEPVEHPEALLLRAERRQGGLRPGLPGLEPA